MASNETNTAAVFQQLKGRIVAKPELTTANLGSHSSIRVDRYTSVASAD
jgi:hypothetical protein